MELNREKFLLNRFLWTKNLFCIFVVLLLLFPHSVFAKIYKWKDEKGKTHYTDNPSKIPKQYNKKGSNLETVSGGPPDLEAVPVSIHFPTNRRSGGKHIIPLKKVSGGNYSVETIINGNVRADLMLDTGASLVILSDRISKLLKLKNLDKGPQMQFSTAGGTISSPLLILKKVQVGSAIVRNVEASINPHMGMMDGLLGMSFLSEYQMEVRSSSNELVLKRHKSKGEPLWDGHTAKWWKTKYDGYTNSIRQYQGFQHMVRGQSKKVKDAKKMVKYYEKLHRALEQRADRAGLPKKYRSYP